MTNRTQAAPPRVCTACAAVGIFRWQATCEAAGHHQRVKR